VVIGLGRGTTLIRRLRRVGVLTAAAACERVVVWSVVSGTRREVGVGCF
jgi:hypothetical protein